MAVVPRAELKPDGPVDPADELRHVAGDPLLREAVRLASGSLSAEVDRLEAGTAPGGKRAVRAALSATRYRQRLGGRPTPFGLFAGVAVARTGPVTGVAVRGPGEKSVRVDSGWLEERVREWLATPDVRRGVRVVLNDLCRLRGDRLLLPLPDREISVRLNPVLAWVRTAAAAPVPYAALLTDGADRHPGVTERQLDDLLAQLLQHGFLLASITPHRLDAAYFRELRSAVSAVPEAAGDLLGIQDALDAYQERPAGQGGDELRALVGRLDPAGALRHTPVHVDLRMDAEITVSTRVTEEAARYASAMWAISAEGATHAHMHAYWERFVERYGVDCPVPLPELIDPHRGLGYPAGYRNPPQPGAPSEPAAPAPGDRARRALVAELVQAATLDGSGEVTLHDDDIERLASPVPALPPRSLELCFQLFADSAADIDRGAFRMLSTPFAGSWTAGATAGRFAGLLGLTGELSGLLAGGTGARTDTVRAQVRFRPRTARALNVMQTPTVLPYELPVGVFADPGAPGHMDWRDLLVTAEPGGLGLSWARTGQRVVPVAPHMVALDREAPNLVRLLIDIVFARRRTWSGWDWAGLETLPFLPRISYGKVVAAPRRWRPERRLHDTAAEPAAWTGALEAWRERYGVPDRVQILQQDRAYGVDLRRAWHHRLLRQELAKGPLVLIEDFGADGQGLGWARGHSAELVVPLTRRAPDAAAERPRASVRAGAAAGAAAGVGAARAAYPPGGDWLYAKLYATPDVHDTLLRTEVAGLLDEAGEHVDRWFFVRYRDPRPHLRLRLHGAAAGLNAVVLPALERRARALREAGMIESLELATYEPESARYGGPGAVAAAEALFCLDSRSAVTHLGGQRPQVPAAVLTAAHHALLLDRLGDWDWAAWIDRTLAKSPEHAVFQRHRDVALDVVRPGEMLRQTADRLGAPRLAGLWAQSSAPSAYGRLVLTPPADDTLLALLHMQHNRLAGPDRASERAALAVLRGVARTHLARRSR